MLSNMVLMLVSVTTMLPKYIVMVLTSTYLKVWKSCYSYRKGFGNLRPILWTANHGRKGNPWTEDPECGPLLPQNGSEVPMNGEPFRG